MNVNKQHWIKPYKGPFTKAEAIGIAEDLNKGEHYHARIRAMSILKKQYDVYVKMKMTPDELIAFRVGVKWGFALFSHWEKDTNKMVKTLSDGRTLTQEQFDKEVDEGRWDDVLKTFKNKKQNE